MQKSGIILRYTVLCIISCQVACRDHSPPELVRSNWHFKGQIGAYLDHIAEQRILDERNWLTIYPETENAFRLREDDEAYPEWGKWRGEFWGKYILSAIGACRYYQDEDLKSRVSLAVKGLLSCQDPDGYIGTYKHSGFLTGNNWNVWCRKYTLWGLIEAWALLGDDDILMAAGKLMDHLMTQVGPGAINIVETGNFHGLPSSSILGPVIMLYNATGDDRYLEYARYIVDQWSTDPEGLPDILNKGIKGAPLHTWFEGHDPYQWGKGYEFISCVEGLAGLYEATGEDRYLTAVKNIYTSITGWERTPVGSVSFNDKLVGSSGLINTVAEICDAVYWNRLSFKLFQLTGEVKYIDEFEKTLYNSLLCAYNPQGDWCLRRLRTSHIHIPAQNHFLMHHQCCTDNLPRGLFQAAEMALMERYGEVYLNLFEQGSGQLRLPSGNVVQLNMEGDFLDAEPLRVHISVDHSEAFVLAIRNPGWSNRTAIEVNGNPLPVDESLDWIRIRRRWSGEDMVTIFFEPGIRYEFFDTSKFRTLYHPIDFYNEQWAGLQFLGGTNPANNQRYGHVTSLPFSAALPHRPAVALLYGPMVLARDVRISGPDIFAPMDLPADPGSIVVSRVRPPPNIRHAFELDLGEVRIIRCCDFSSAGNTWSIESMFNTWFLLVMND
jgi:DUF1680 family protein